MVELVRSSDLVHLSWVQAMLTAEGIPFLVADAHISSVEGGIGAFPRRVLVLDEDLRPAELLLEAAAAAGTDARPD